MKYVSLNNIKKFIIAKGPLTVSILLSAIFLIINQVQAVSFNGTYNIPGDYASFAGAISELAVEGVSGPVVFNVDSGTYNEQITIPVITGASAVNTITFQSASGVNTDVILSYAPSTNNWVIRFDGADYIRFKNMTIENTSTIPNYGIVIEFDNNTDSTTDIIIEGNIINGRSDADVNSGYDVINQYSTTLNKGEQIVIRGNIINFGSNGIALGGDGTSGVQSGNIIEKNIIQNYYADGITAEYQAGIQITGNQFSGKSINPNMETGIYLYMSEANCTIAGNKITQTNNNGETGIYIKLCTGTALTPILVYNNMINNSGINDSFGIYNYASKYVKTYHNTVNITAGSQFWSFGYYFDDSGTPDTYASIENNIFVNTGGGMAIGLEQTGGTYIASCNYNDLFVTGANIGYYTGGSYSTSIADWTTNTLLDANSVSLDPGFISSSDLHLSAANPSLILGNSLPEVNNDFDGQIRNIDSPYIGADEYLTFCPSTNILYVDEAATGLNNGNDWINAYTNLQDALSAAASGVCTSPVITEIHVAQGTYKPGINRTDTFQLINGIAIYGGYSTGGGEYDPKTYPANLSGDIGIIGDNTDNSYHVVKGDGTDNTAVLDGFVIMRGNADSTLPDNRGGGIHIGLGSPKIQHCVFIWNSGSSGAGMYISGNPYINKCNIRNNTAFGNGAGIFIDTGSPSIKACTFSENTTPGSSGGGIFNQGDLLITDCTFVNNSAAMSGGGIMTQTGSLSISNCTFSTNSASVNGGGLNIDSGSLIISLCTFINNTSSVNGGGIYVFEGLVDIKNSIVADSVSNDFYNSGGTITSDYNIIENPVGYTSGSNDINGSQTGLNIGSFANNGGDIQTYALLTGSIAIDAGDPEFAPPPDFDQRGLGYPRLVDGNGDTAARVDIGAFEAPVLAGGSDSDASLTSADIIMEPVPIPSTANSPENAVEIFDFTLSDGGSSDGLPLEVFQIVLHTSGNGDFSKISWILKGPDAVGITGTYDNTANTLTFFDLNILVDNSASEIYTLSAYYQNNTSLIEGETYILSVDGAADVITGTSGTQMGTTNLVSNSSGSLVQINSTSLLFNIQPVDTQAGNQMPVFNVRLTDDFGNTDLDSTAQVELSLDNNPGSSSISGTNPVSVTDGVANFSNIVLDKTGTSYTFRADSPELTGAVSAPFNIVSGLLDYFFIEAEGGGSIETQTAGIPFNTKITAKDVNDNVKTDFNETVQIKSSGKLSTGSGTTAAFVDGILLSHNIAFSNAGIFTITAEFGEVSGTSNEFAVYPKVSIISPSPITEGTGSETTQLSFEVKLSAVSTETVTIPFTYADQTATELDYNITSVSPLIFSPGTTIQTILAEVVKDSLSEPDESFTITLDTPTNAFIENKTATGTILDDDSSGLILSPVSGNTEEDGTQAEFTVKLNTQPDGDVVINAIVSDPTEARVLPTTLKFTFLNWNIDQKITITGIDDDITDGNQEYFVGLTVDTANTKDTTGYKNLAPQNVILINIDDETIGFIITPVSGNTGESGTHAEFKIRLNTAPNDNVVVDVLSSDTTEGIVSPESLTFTPEDWNIEQKIIVTGVDDLTEDGNSQYFIMLNINIEGTTDTTGYAYLESYDISMINLDNDTTEVVDGCPHDPYKTEPGVCGCGVPDIDTDDDGIMDCNDKCPNDPLKTEAGVCGCGTADTDKDEDGTPDCNDSCPDDPLKTEAGVCGCGVPDIDTDKDGILDCNDNCPDDPLKTEAGVCGCGTADTDKDGDGTPDCNDSCPDDSFKTEIGICGCGAADIDTDNDGTPDCIDNCPDDPLKTEAGNCGCGEPERINCQMNKPPDAPMPIFPKDNSIIPPGPVTFEATKFSDPEDDIPSHITLEIRKITQECPEIVYETDMEQNSYTIQNIKSGIKYAWKIGYKDSGSGLISWSRESVFTLGYLASGSTISIDPGILSEHFRAVSFPYWLDDSSLTGMLKKIMGTSLNKEDFRIAIYVQGRGYIEYGSPYFEIIPARACWFLARNGLDLFPVGVSVNEDEDYEISLDKGWNLIGPPNHADYSWSKLEIIYSQGCDIIFGPVMISEMNFPNDYIDNRLWRWEEGEYHPDTDLMEQENGYWVKAKTQGVGLIFTENSRIQSGLQTFQLTRQTINESLDTPPRPLEMFEYKTSEISNLVDSGGGGCFIKVSSEQ